EDGGGRGGGGGGHLHDRQIRNVVRYGRLESHSDFQGIDRPQLLYHQLQVSLDLAASAGGGTGCIRVGEDDGGAAHCEEALGEGARPGRVHRRPLLRISRGLDIIGERRGRSLNLQQRHD
ncbi:hypothetical protein PFISCL1PPCAC_12517, partial [Pristionchus fissidentatus]